MKHKARVDQTNFGSEYNELNIHECQWQLLFCWTKQKEYQSSYLHLNGRNRFRNISGTYLKASTLRIRLVSDCLPCEWNFPKKKLPVTPYTSVSKYSVIEKTITFIQKYLEIKNTNEISKNWLLVATVCRRMWISRRVKKLISFFVGFKYD